MNLTKIIFGLNSLDHLYSSHPHVFPEFLASLIPTGLPWGPSCPFLGQTLSDLSSGLGQVQATLSFSTCIFLGYTHKDF